MSSDNKAADAADFDAVTDAIFAELREATTEIARRYPVVCVVMMEHGPAISASVPHESIPEFLEIVADVVRRRQPARKELHTIKKRASS